MALNKKYMIIGNNFADLVSQYVNIIDSKFDMPRIDFLLIIHRLLSKIYAAGATLPSVESTKTEVGINKTLAETMLKINKILKEPARQNLSERTDLFFKRMKKIKKLLGKYDGYWHIFDPIDEKEKDDPTYYCISGDLAEIYDDLKKGLKLWNLNDPIEKERAMSKWQRDFDIHWGHHAIIVLRVIHRRIEEYFLDYDEDDFNEIRNRYL